MRPCDKSHILRIRPVKPTGLRSGGSQVESMRFTLEYRITEKWYVGKLKEVPGVFSQGKTFNELKVNIRDAYELMMEIG